MSQGNYQSRPPSYGSFGVPRPPGVGSPPPYTVHPTNLGSVPPSSNSSPTPPTTTNKGTSSGVWVIIFLIVVAFFYYDTPLCEAGRLEKERQLLKDERQLLKKERERWERAREDRIPQGAFWDTLWPAEDCLAYGKREYWGTLQNIPGDWTAMDACMNKPVEIKGVSVRRPHRCAYVEGSPHIHGYWTVDWDQPDCKPLHQDFTDKGCTHPGSGTRRIEAWVVGINDTPEQDWRLLCESTPMTWNHITYNSPTHCEARWFGKKFAVWDIPDDSC